MLAPALSLLVTAALAASPDSSFFLKSAVLDYETGPIHIFQNEGRYGANGTLYTAEEVGQTQTLFNAQRLALDLQLGERHHVVFLYAPLDVTTRATPAQPFQFRGTLFAAGTPLAHRYLFDGYRGSYLFTVYQGGPFKAEVGASFQIRNASVEFSTLDGTQFDRETDIGLVFAVKARLRYDFPWGLYALLDADGLSTFGLGLKGGIYDVALTLGVPLTPATDLFFRLRFLGGGAEVPRRDIYNWGNFGFALVGVRSDLMQFVPAH